MRDQPTALIHIHPERFSRGRRRAGDRQLLERQLGILGQLAEDGLQIAQAVARQATRAGTAEPAHAVVQGDIGLAHARVARAVCLTIMLRSKVIQQLQALETARSDEDALRRGPHGRRKARVLRTVPRARAEHEDVQEVERRIREAAELTPKASPS